MSYSNLFFVLITTSFLFPDCLWASPKPVRQDHVHTVGKYDSSTAIQVHDGRVWFGDDRMADQGAYKFLGYNGTSLEKEFDSIVKHSILSINVSDLMIYAYGSKSDPWHNKLTQIREQRDGSFEVRTHRYSIYEFFENLKILEERWFYVDGGNNQILQTTRIGGYRPIGTKISNAVDLTMSPNNLLWVVERKTHFGENGFIRIENIAVIDLASNRTTRYFEGMIPTGINQILYNPASLTVAFNRSLTNTLTILSAEDASLSKDVSVAGGPEALDAYGECFAVLGRENHTISFVHGRSGKVLDQWSIQVDASDFREPRSLAVDARSGAIFVRAVIPCYQDCEESPNGVYRFLDETGETAKACRL